MKKIIEVSNLTKKYGDLEAVKGLTFDVYEGSLFAFLGTNGAGKSSTINILTTIIEKTSGDVVINGFKLGDDDYNIRHSIGVVFQNSTLDNKLTVYENLKVRGCMYSFSKNELEERIKKVSKVTECDKFLSQRYGQLSGGQKRKVDIASVLIHEPKILFLDEPTTGLDPASRIAIWEMIFEMQRTLKTTVFLTTHYMEEASHADYVAIVNKGKIISKGTPLELKEKYASDIIKIYNPNEDIENLLIHNNINYNLFKNIITIKFNGSYESIEILNILKDSISSYEVLLGNMDDVFINIIELNERDEL